MNETEEDKLKSDVFKKIKRADLVISRVPTPTLDFFKELADKEFCNDYGMALKHLIDICYGQFPMALQELNDKITRLENALKAPVKEEKKIMTNAGPINIEEVKSE
jgi:hypothetical protein